MSGSTDDEARPAILLATLKSAGALAAVAFGMALWLSSADLGGRSSAAAFAGMRGIEDPITTGSLAGSAGATRLDPCVLPRR